MSAKVDVFDQWCSWSKPEARCRVCVAFSVSITLHYITLHYSQHVSNRSEASQNVVYLCACDGQEMNHCRALHAAINNFTGLQKIERTPVTHLDHTPGPELLRRPEAM